MKPRSSAEGVVVAAVGCGTPAAAAGLRAGDRILAVNGHALRDAIDFRFHGGDERLELRVERDGAPRALRVARRPGADLGVELEAPRAGEITTCANKCVFCFIHQLPPGLRKSLYVKDDDYRLSFLHGNYITLTDLPDNEIQRIVDLRLSPLYISVHATDPGLRHFLLGSPKTIKGDLMERLRRLADAGIRLHTQIVLCPGLNDGPHLERTVRELGELHPGVTTVAVVPVGLTRHRDGLYPLRSVTPAEAGATLDAIHAWQAHFRVRYGTRLVFAADELYLQAGRPIPPATAYEGFSVVEDGVGLVRRFEDDYRRLAARPGRSRWRGERVVTVVTGELFGPILSGLLERLRVPGLRAEAVAVPNEFFGRAITVVGLLTGQDVARALSGRPLGHGVLIPRVALTETKGVFLDDVAPEDLARHLEVPVITVEPSARGLVDGLLGRTPTPA